ncbi:hypothetical protein JMJ56_21875 [Belnapia sp. T18]|uniref:Uncharacterized protein n=2 Tax=Belnapia arida TaxID=2804533 RepID=A0ABS1U806_9PROT|nr:hypothetical protein [Belnapia arida]
MIKELHPQRWIAEQTFYNKTPSSFCYREVISIWQTYRRTVDQLRKTRLPSNVQDDLPDILLNQLQPESARVIVLAMRTSLRNMHRQIGMLRSLTPDKLVRHREPAPNAGASLTPLSILTREESDILSAFIDPTEASSRGGAWDDLGRLVANGEALSRAGLLQIVMKVLDTSLPPKPASDKTAAIRKAKKR